MNKEQLLFEAALDCLYDLCPADEEFHLCNGSEEYDEEICTRCWSAYIYYLVNK